MAGERRREASQTCPHQNISFLCAGPVGQPSPDGDHRRPARPAPLFIGGGVVAVMRQKRKAGGYKGELASPIICPSPPTFEGAVTKKRLAEFSRIRARHGREAEKATREKRLAKLSLLFEHYGIGNKRNMRALVLALASEHVPGFKIAAEKKPRRGRRLEWDPDKLFALLEAVRKAKTRGGLTDKNALWLIATNAEFAVTWGFPPDRASQSQKQKWIETLQSRLNDAKRLEKLMNENDREVRAFLEEAAANLPEKFRKK